MYYKGKKVKGPIAPSTDFHGFGDKIRAEIAKRIAPNRAMRVLDVGTGFGSNVTFLARALPKGSAIWTIDPSREVLENVKTNLAQLELGVDVEFVQAGAEELDFADGFFDAAVSVMVLHHLKDLGAVFREISRVLKEDGRLVVVDYKPEASKKLEFQSRHLATDFFKPSTVKKAILENTGSVIMKDFGLWYLAEATKRPRH